MARTISLAVTGLVLSLREDTRPGGDGVGYPGTRWGRGGPPRVEETLMGTTPKPGTDTPTGTDPDAKWDGPGYEDKSLGQAVAQDEELVDALLEETGDEEEAARRFEEESAGAPALRRQADEHDG
jgi:hypothetical protein